ncbi:MAG: hypothetical protein ACYSWO_23535 [Planctomycetota bacterium]
MQSIEKFRQTKSIGGHRFSDQTLDKLDQMMVGQMIELRNVEARKQSALKIRGRDKAFVEALSNWQKLDNAVNRLVRDRGLFAKRQQQSEARLADDPDKQLPVVYQNKVMIYPIRTD